MIRDTPERTTVEWYTPPAIVQALGGLEGFDLDPCTPEDPSVLPAPTARRMIRPSEDGLATPWPEQAHVWMNPPYGRGMERWLEKLANHPGGGIALVPANMDPAWMHDYILKHPNANAMLATRGRLRFVRPDGSLANAAPGGSVFVAYGARAESNLRMARHRRIVQGHVLEVGHRPSVAAPRDPLAFTELDLDLVAMALASEVRRKGLFEVRKLVRQRKVFQHFHERVEVRRLLNHSLDAALADAAVFERLANPDCVGVDTHRARRIVEEVAQRLRAEAKAARAKQG